ncbi:MAG: hypothetical protein ACRD8A_18480 [Candidatus Acidiferrales bacterium]
MAGWHLDVVIGYLITLCKRLARMWRSHATSDWQKVNATLCGANVLSKTLLPRSLVEIVYTYRLQGGFYGGVDEKPFFLRTSAQAYAAEWKRGDELIIRVSPDSLEKSALCDEDQAVDVNRARA